MMIRSMTGFGRSEQKLDGREIIVEIKSVNHRYLGQLSSTENPSISLPNSGKNPISSTKRTMLSALVMGVNFIQISFVLPCYRVMCAHLHVRICCFAVICGDYPQFLPLRPQT